MVFSGFISFIQKVEKSGNKDILKWINVKNQMGDDTVSKLMNWVVKFQRFEEEFFYLVKKINSIFNFRFLFFLNL